MVMTLAACGGGETDDASAEPDGPTTERDSGSIDEAATTTDETDTTDEAAADEAADSGGAATGRGPPFEPPVRDDDLLLVFSDGTLGPVGLGSTRDDMIAALGPDFRIGPTENVRPGFPAGFSVSWQGEVLFWAIEEAGDEDGEEAGGQDGEVELFMTNNPRVGLDSGLRPRLPLADAIEIYGEPSLLLGPELREFASFPDGAAEVSGVSVLVAIGEFGGPVGLYDAPGGELLQEADGYVLEGANVKELWFAEPPA